MNDTSNDAALVAAARTGDEPAFAELFTRWSGRCFDVARRILHDDGRAAEVTQEVFTVAWQQLGSLRDPAAFGGWVLRTSRNRALNRLDHERRAIPTDDTHPVLAGLVGNRSVEAEAAEFEHEELVWAAAAALGERDASVLDLHLRHGLSVPEIAEELGVTTNNAHQMLHRTKQRLATGIRAWVVFRGGDTSCAALSDALDAAGVTRFGPEAVKAISTHIGECDACDRRQAAVLAPEALFAAAPIAVLSAELRETIAAGLRRDGVPVGGGPDPVSAGGSGDGGGGAMADGGAPTVPVAPAGGSAPAGDGGSAGAGRSGRRALVVAVAAIIGVLAVIGALVARSGDDHGDSQAASRSRATTTLPEGRGGGSEPEPTDTTSTTSTTTPSGGDLVGAWTADASDILGANTANVGGPRGLSCAGPITMTFTDEGTYTRNGSVSCSAGALSAAGTLATSGSYRTSGDALTVADTRNDGTISLGGRAVPFPDAFGDGDATYAIEGSTLRITFGGPGVGTVTQTYRRS